MVGCAHETDPCDWIQSGLSSHGEITDGKSGGSTFSFDMRDRSTSVLTSALRRAAKNGDISHNQVLSAQIPYYIRSKREVLLALSALSRRSGAAFDTPELEIMDVEGITIDMCQNMPDRLSAMTDLAWSIHQNALQTSSGCTPKQMQAVKRQLKAVLSETFFSPESARDCQMSYLMLAVRRKEENHSSSL
jgi:hypothetical protein